MSVSGCWRLGVGEELEGQQRSDFRQDSGGCMDLSGQPWPTPRGPELSLTSVESARLLPGRGGLPWDWGLGGLLSLIVPQSPG